MSVEISVIIPAYNEARRLPAYLHTVRAYLEAHYPCRHEVVVVDDGSEDGTAACVTPLARDGGAVRLVRLERNMGKGLALCAGVAEARGDYILITDADGATPIAEEARLRAALAGGADVAVGCRDADARLVRRHWLRRRLGAAFAWAAARAVRLPVRDTQCGFKMFRREVGRRLFSLSQEPGYLIDVEILLHAQRLGYRVEEVPVMWRDMPGSKVRLLRDGWKMCLGLWRLRRARAELAPRYGPWRCDPAGPPS